MSEISESSDYLPDEFWESSPALKYIYEVAQNRPCAPDAVLHSMLARLAACIDPAIRLELPFASSKPVSCYAGIFGNPGSGKGEAEALAEKLLPFGQLDREHIAMIKLATPEGLVQAYMVREESTNDITGETIAHMVQAYRRGYVLESEGSVFTSMARKEDSKFNGLLCGMWMSEEAGSSLANDEKSRLLPKGGYTIGMSISVQLEPAAQLLAMKSVGLPQRLGWAHARPNPAHRRNMVDVSEFTSLEEFKNLMTSPEALVVEDQQGREVRLGSWVMQLKEMSIDPTLDMTKDLYGLIYQRSEMQELDVHEPLWKSRYTVLMALLGGQTEISDLHWWQAGVLWDTSRAVRQLVELEVEKNAAAERTTDAMHRAGTAAQVQEILTGVNPMVVTVAKSIHRALLRNDGKISQRKAQRSCVTKWHRDAYGTQEVSLWDAAAAYAKEKRWVRTCIDNGEKCFAVGTQSPETK